MQIVMGNKQLETQRELIAYHNDILNIGIRIPVAKEIAGIHIAKVKLV